MISLIQKFYYSWKRVFKMGVVPHMGVVIPTVRRKVGRLVRVQCQPGPHSKFYLSLCHSKTFSTYFCFWFLLFFFFWNIVSLCNPGWPGTSIETRLASNSQKASSLCLLGARINDGQHLVQHSEDLLKGRREIKNIGTAFENWTDQTYYQLPVAALTLRFVGL